MDRLIRTIALPTLLMLALIPTLSCAKPEPTTLNISAASSLTDAIIEINALFAMQYPSINITPNFASSGTLQQQIENGAPCDIFISAATTQMDNLQNKQLILNDTLRNLLNNRLVLIVPADSKLNISRFDDLIRDDVKKIAIGVPDSVPAGIYAQQSFDLLGITSKLQHKLVLASNVRQVLAYVENGNVDAGIVFSTDSLISTKIKVMANAPSEVNAKIVYPIAVIKSSRNASTARNYLDFLFSEVSKVVFEKYGFTVVAK